MEFRNGKIYDEDGNPHNMHDYYSTKDIIPRIYDYNTKNKAFLNIHKLLKLLGVKNHSEHLQLFNKDLLGVDVRDPRLTDDLRFAIFQECKMNLWYFLREVVVVPEGDNMLPFDLNIGAFCTTWLCTRNQNFLYIISRQIGKTFLMTTILAWVLIFGGSDMLIKNIHHSKDPAVGNINKIKKVLELIPGWMQVHKKEYDKPDKKTGLMKVKNILAKSDNARTLECKPYKNKIETVVVGNTLDSADRAGRGATANIYFIDEVAHTKNNNIAFGALNQSTTEARLKSIRSGCPYGIWMLGTPGNLKTPHGRWIYEKIRNEYIPFTYRDFHLLDKTQKEIEEYINKRSISNFWFVEFDWDILGYSEKWFFDKNRNEDVPGIRREVLLNWEDTNTNSPFTRTQISALEQKSRKINPVHIEYDDFNTFTIYPKQGDRTETLEDFLVMNSASRTGIIIGIDVANGTGRDSSTMVFVNAKTLEVIATYHNNMINTDDFAILLAHILEDIVLKHDLKCAVGLERNNSGTSVIAKLKKHRHLLRYLIAYPVSESKIKDLSKPADIDFFRGNVHVRADIGLNVGDRIRTLFTDDLLFTLVSKHTDVYAVPDIVNELKGLIRVKRLSRTRIEHSAETHDDLIFGSFHAYYPIFYASKILKMNHKINVDATEWKTVNGVEIFKGMNLNTRIQEIYETDINGNLLIRYFDNVTGRYISEEEYKDYIKNKDKSAIMKEESINDIYEKPKVIIEDPYNNIIQPDEKKVQENFNKLKIENERLLEEIKNHNNSIQPTGFMDEEEANQFKMRNNTMYNIYDEMDRSVRRVRQNNRIW